MPYLRRKKEQLLFGLFGERCGILLLLFFLKMFRQVIVYLIHQHEFGVDSDCEDDDRQLCLCHLKRNEKVSIYHNIAFCSNDFSCNNLAVWQAMNTFLIICKDKSYSWSAKFE